jgi:hypothetical protein
LTTQQELSAMQKTAEKLNDNQVARFAYTEQALADEDVDGVAAFDVAADQNVPTKDHTDYDPMVLDRGVRSQGASIPRMGINHFFGRASFNLNLLVRKLALFFPVLRRALAHNANEYDPQAEYAAGDVCYIVETSGDSVLYTWHMRVSASPLYIVNVSPAVSGAHWKAMTETTIANLLSDELPLMNGTRSAGTSDMTARDDHVHGTDTSRAPNYVELLEENAASALPAAGYVPAILQTIRNCLKWLSLAAVSNSGITQLTGDVTAPATVNGSAVATLAASGATAGSYGDGGAARTLSFGGTFKIPATLTVDAKGRVTAVAAITMTMPANPDTDNRGITQLTGDVTAPATTSGSAAATLAASGVTAGAYGDGGAARTLAYGGTFKVLSTLTVDAKGRVTAAGAIALTMPADNRGITQLTGDVTAPATTSGSAAATIKSSVALAGAPTAPTAPINANTTQLANTEFVRNQLEEERGYVPVADPGALAGYGRLWTNAEGLLVVNDHLIEWGRNIVLEDLFFFVSGGETRTLAVEVSGIYRYTVAGAKGGKGADSRSGVTVGGSGGLGAFNEGTVALHSTEVIRITSGAHGADGSALLNGGLVVLGANASFFSADGSAWTEGNLALTDPVAKMAYGNGVFVGVRLDGYVAISSDGIAWAASGIPGNTGIRDIAYGNGVFVAIDTTRSFVSTDGISWISVNMNAPDNVLAVAYGNGLFVATTRATSSSTVSGFTLTSTDGVSWSSHKNSPYNAKAMAYGNGTFVATQQKLDSGQVHIAYSTNSGDTWTFGGAPSGLPSVYTLLFESIAYGNGLFVAIARSGYSISTATGIGVSSGTLPVFDTKANALLWYSVAYGDGKFVAVGTAGKIAVSPDGVTWTSIASPTTNTLAVAASFTDQLGGGEAGGVSVLENLSTGLSIIQSAGGGGGGGAYNTPNDGEAGENAASNILGGAGGTSSHPNGYPGQGGASAQDEGYVQLVFQRPL